jgi:HEAT repeat protein
LSELTLEPGKQFTQRILLNYEHRLNTPGDYDIDAVKHLGHFADSFEVRKQLHLRVTDTASFGDRELQLLASKLKSKDADEQNEAARTLASVAPLSLESTILGFADNEQFRRFAPLAFHNLNTDRSLSALGELVIKTKPGTYEQMEGIKYLAETGDSRWFPLLRELAQNHANISNYVVAAAEAGGDEAVPFLIQQMRSDDKEFAVPNAISGFGHTGSRSAVPILLDLLKSPEDGISQRALFGLRKLTHMSFGGEKWFENPQKQYVHWSQWWSREGANARIYKTTECGEYAPLP